MPTCDGDAQALLRTIIDLGHSLNMQVTAEGIERTEELGAAGSLGCDQSPGLPDQPADGRCRRPSAMCGALAPSAAQAIPA